MSARASFLALALAAAGLPGCSSGVEELYTQSGLTTATGAFAALGDGTYASATSNLPCERVGFFLTEERAKLDGEYCSGCVRLFPELPHPFFLGRVYRAGTLLDPVQKWWISEGTVTVRDLAWTELIGQGDWYIELEFDAALRQTESLGWDDLRSDPSDSRLKGWVRFQYSGFKYRSTDRQDCPPPDRAVGPPYEESTGRGPVAGPLEETAQALASLPVVTAGVARAQVDVALQVRTLPQGARRSDLEAYVTQDASPSANGLCEVVVQGYGGRDAAFCPGGAPPSFTRQLLLDDRPVNGLQVTLANAWNLPLGFSLPTAMVDPPRLLSPAGKAERPSSDPIDVTWAPARPGEKVVLRLRTTFGVAWEAEVEDKGSAQIPVVWAASEGGFDLELVKPVAVAPPAPLAAGSSLRTEFIDVAYLSLRPWRDWAFTDPAQGSADWLAPEEVARDELLSRAPTGWAACAFPDGTLGLAWFEVSPAEGATRFVMRRSGQAGWGPRVQVEVGAGNGWQPLQLACAEGGALAYTSLRMGGQWQPHAVLFPTTGTPVAVDVASLGVEPAAYPIVGAVLADGTAALAGVRADGNLYGVWQGAVRQLTTGGPANPRFLEGHVLGGSVLGLSTHRGEDFVLTHWEPANPGAPRELTFLPVRDCGDPGGTSTTDRLWSFCSRSSLVAYSLVTGAPLGPPEPVTDDRRLVDLDLNQQVLETLSVGPAGHLCVRYTLPCQWGRCTLLFRRGAEGGWSGPAYPGWPPDPATLVVDASGAPHLFWSTAEGVLHTREVR